MSAPTTARRSSADLVIRLVVVTAAAAAGALQAPAWLRAPLAVAAAAAVVSALVGRRRGRGLLDALVLGVGGAVVAVALLGPVLNVLPGGLTALSWSVAVGVGEALALVLLARRRPDAPAAGRARPAVLPFVWGAAVLAVLTGALLLSIGSFDRTHVEPLALALAPGSGTRTITVTSGTPSGPYELDLVTTSGRTVLARGVLVGPDQAGAAGVQLPAGTRGLVQLVPDGGGTPIRQLVLDDTAAAHPTSTGSSR